MFNSLLILLPVIGARAVANAYDQDLTSREGAAEALQHASEKLLDELATIGPRDENSKLPYWQDRIVAELDARNMSAVRGYMLAAPQMLGRDLGEQIRVRAEAEVTGTPDERLIRAAMQKLPEAVATRILETERFNPPAASPSAEDAASELATADPAPAETPEAQAAETPAPDTAPTPAAEEPAPAPEPTPPPQPVPSPTVIPPAPDLQDMLDSLTSEFNSFVPPGQAGEGDGGGNTGDNANPNAGAAANNGRGGDGG